MIRFVMYAAVVWTLLCAVPAAVWAQGDDGAERAYRGALEAFQNGELERADKLLSQAYSIDPKPIYVFNRIIVLERLRRYDEAIGLIDKHRDAMQKDAEIGKDDLIEVETRLRKAKQRQDLLSTGPTRDIDTDRQPFDLKTVLLFAGGGISLLASAGFVINGNNIHDTLRCSPDSGSGQSQSVDCQDIPKMNFTREEWEAEETRLILSDTAAVGFGLLGVGLIGWGLYEVLRKGESTDSERRTTLQLQASPQGGAVGVQMRF